MKDGDLVPCRDCDGKGFNYVRSIYAPPVNVFMDRFSMVDVEPEECNTCDSKGVVIVTKEKEDASC